jgi:hypothetical protein
MDNEHDHIIEDEPIAAGPASGAFARGLWWDVRWWLYQATVAFGPLNEIAAGLSRSLGRRLSAWLYAIEGATRRLILSAAIALQLSPIARASRPPSPRKPQPPRPRRAGFRVFAIVPPVSNTDPSPTAARSSGRAIAPFRHVAYSADPLLRIGAEDITRQRRPHGQRPHAAFSRPAFRPLHTYQTATDIAGVDTSGDVRLRAAIAHYRPSGPRRHLTRAERIRKGRALAIRDGLRALAERDAARVIPAPHLARRLEALLALVQNPQTVIDRTARRLAQAEGAPARLVHAPAPVLRQPAYEKRPMPARALLDGACTLWPPPAHDSS